MLSQIQHIAKTHKNYCITVVWKRLQTLSAAESQSSCNNLRPTLITQDGSALVQNSNTGGTDATAYCTIIHNTALSHLFTYKSRVYMCPSVQMFPFSPLTLLVGRQEGHLACIKLGVGLSVVTIWLELCRTYSSSCHHHLQHP